MGNEQPREAWDLWAGLLDAWVLVLALVLNDCVTMNKSLSCQVLPHWSVRWVGGGEQIPGCPSSQDIWFLCSLERPKRKGGQERVPPWGGNRRHGLVGSTVLQPRGKGSVGTRRQEGWMGLIKTEGAF